MRRIRLREAPRGRVAQDTELASANARLRKVIADAERELTCCERQGWAGGRAALEPHMKGALSILRAGLDG